MHIGDIVGFSGASFQSDVINIATYGIPRYSLSHVGYVDQFDGKPILVESTTEDCGPCVITGKTVRGVKAHWLYDRIASYHGKAWHYPLVASLYPEQVERLSKFTRWHLGQPYDDVGAFRAGGFGWRALLHAESRSSLFCSELCAAALAKVGAFLTSRPSRWSPNLLVRTMREEGRLDAPRRLK